MRWVDDSGISYRRYARSVLPIGARRSYGDAIAYLVGDECVILGNGCVAEHRPGAEEAEIFDGVGRGICAGRAGQASERKRCSNSLPHRNPHIAPSHPIVGV